MGQIEGIKWLIAVLSTVFSSVLTWMYGPMNSLYSLLLVLTVIDFITGVMKAFASKSLDSAQGRRGIAHKINMWLIVMIAFRVDVAIPGIHGALASATCMFFIANEALSIFENAAAMGVPLPKTLLKALSQLKEEDETKDKNGGKKDE